MQRPWNCNIYTSRPPAKQRMARLAWDYFMFDEEGRTPNRMWFVRDTPPWSYWIMEWKGETDDDCDHDEVMPQELRDWHEHRRSAEVEITNR